MAEGSGSAVAYLGIDVGKRTHGACALDEGSAVVFRADVENRPGDVSMFRGRDELASYCGVAPADGRSGTSVRSTSPQRGGNKQLKNLLIFSCNSLIGTDNRFGRYYDECRARGMRHNKALKAVAGKRLKVIYAVMRDAAPYSA